MTTEAHDTLERIARRVAVPGPAYDRLLQRRARVDRRRRVATTVVVVAVWCAVAAIVLSSVRASRVPADPPPDTGTLLPLAAGSYRVDAATGNAEPFAPIDGGAEWAPIPSVRDGFALTLEEGGRRQLWLDSPLLGTFPLTDMVWTGNPVWSYDGAFIAFDGQATEGGIRRVYVVDIGEGRITPLTDGPSSGATWTRDGNAILVSAPSGGPGGSSIVRVAILREAGPAPVEVGTVSTVRIGASDPTLAADGRLAYVDAATTNDGRRRLLVVGDDGTTSEVAAAPGLADPLWSPDGATIAFVVDGLDGPETWTVDVATGDVTRSSFGRPSAWEGSETLLVDVVEAT